MNILYLTPDFNYGDGRSYYVYLLLKYFQRAGHNVYLCTNAGDSFDRLEEIGIKVFTLGSLSSKTSFVSSVQFVSEIINSHNIGILHSHHRYYELLAVAASKNKNVRTVFTALSIVNKRYFVEYRSDSIIAVSNAVKKMLTDTFKVSGKKISIIPNFVDSEELKTGHSISPPKKNAINILSVGRFHKDKDYGTLFEAVSMIKDFNLEICLIGEGEEIDNYKKVTKAKKLNVRFISPRRNLKEFFDVADICILPSVKDPLPGFMLQSGLHKKPFIGSDVDGIGEVITDGVNGALFKKKDAAELSEKIKLFLSDKLHAEKCAENLHGLIFEKYSETSVIPQIEKLYAGLSD